MQDAFQNASFIKRMMALFYDTLIIVAILFLATFIALLINQGESFNGSIWFVLYLLTWIGAYYIWSWYKGGQTVGMRAWQLKLISEGKQLTLIQAIMRYFGAIVGVWCFGLGLVWCLLDRDKQSLADRLAKCKMISLKRERA